MEGVIVNARKVLWLAAKVPIEIRCSHIRETTLERSREGRESVKKEIHNGKREREKEKR